jgi:hypothetical protein
MLADRQARACAKTLIGIIDHKYLREGRMVHFIAAGAKGTKAARTVTEDGKKQSVYAFYTELPLANIPAEIPKELNPEKLLQNPPTLWIHNNVSKYITKTINKNPNLTEGGVAAQIAELVAKARLYTARCKLVITNEDWLRDGRVAIVVEELFPPGAFGLGDTNLREMARVLQATHDGLMSCFDIKLYHSESGEAAFVQPHKIAREGDDEKGELKKDAEGNYIAAGGKKSDGKIPQMMYNTVTKSPAKVLMGQMHLNLKYLNGKDTDETESNYRLMLKTLIHEATHRYAGTNDYFYFDEDENKNFKEPRAQMDEKLSSTEKIPRCDLKSMTGYEWVRSADSYGWMVLKMAEKLNFNA